MKRALLVPLGLVALLVPAFAAAAPSGISFNSSGFDFTDTSLTTAYIGFAWNGSQLEVKLSSVAPVSSIPEIDVGVPASTTNDMGQTVYPGLGSLADITRYSYANMTDGFSVTHPSTSLSTVVDAYVANLTKLGFTAAEQPSTSPDLVIYTFTHNATVLRAVFHRNGPDVTAYVTGAASS